MSGLQGGARRPAGGGRWIALVVGLLAANAGVCLLLVIRSSDAAPSVIPDYYQRAVAWDDDVARQRASDALGWRLGAALEDAGPGVEVAVSLTGRDGAPVVGATVEAELRHRSRATGETRQLREIGPGRYAAALPLATAGLHVVAVVATRGDERFVGSVTVERGRPR